MASTSSDKRKIVVLGGGIAALSAVFDLTSERGWQERYDITVHQMGWRLGGKGASSRNSQRNNRIEEHGLHIWLGFYENAFEIMRRCYAELSGTPGIFDSWQEAFKPHSFIVLEERTDTGWLHWPTAFPANDSLPGDGTEFPTLWDSFLMLLDWLAETFQAKQDLIHSDTPVDLSSWSSSIVDQETTPSEKVRYRKATRLIRAVRRRGHKSGGLKRTQRRKELTTLLDDFSHWFGRVLEKDLVHDLELRRIFIPIDLLSTVARGMLADGVLESGFDPLDDFEFRDWLSRHGASRLTLSSAWLRGAYDLAFSFEDGDSSKPNIAAGVALRALFRMVFTYKGGVLWKMQAGMGETVFTPMYLVLRNRGVKFKFFHKVETLALTPDKKQIGHIEVSVQATVKGQDYAPLERIGRWDCWGGSPDYTQLEEGEELRARNVNLESNWSNWPAVRRLTLVGGTDFDDIILGIPVAALKPICGELAEARPEWRRMFEGVKTIQTQGFQVWLTKNLSECGWDFESPVLGAYVEPLDTWADMTHLIPAENWPTEKVPKQLAYFCGVMPDAATIPDVTETRFPEEEKERARATACKHLTENACYLWPKATLDQGRFDWNVLLADEDAKGEQRFASQYWRPNIDPSERYTLAVAGSTKYRLRADGSGFNNLTLAGDWLRNGLNTPGCIESAVISGRQAARALEQSKRRIIGETDFPPEASLWVRVLRWILKPLQLVLVSATRFIKASTPTSTMHLNIAKQKLQGDRKNDAGTSL